MDRKTPSPKRGEQRRRVRKAAIVDAAEKVFAEKPFPKVSMRDIAREAGISPALIYRHFPDQQHLFMEAFLRGTTSLLERFADHVAKTGGQGLEEASDTFITFLTERGEYFKMMTHFMLEGTVHGELLERLNAIERSLLERFDELFVRAGATGNVRLMSHCFFAALNGILITFRQHPGRSDLEVRQHMHQIGRIMARMFLQAAQAGPGAVFP
ncbi:MAG TPA: TetR/AcrR family transcriptional regulator [Deltaproteobacteria bacterium]|nr:TetR/AcrR family transcriptional regulator [Deltaproteobacteria bacterium]